MSPAALKTQGRCKFATNYMCVAGLVTEHAKIALGGDSLARTDPRYVCQSCGASRPRWVGKCNACGAWNSITEEKAREDTVPKVASEAPDFVADVLGSNRERTGEQVRLSELRGKPVAIAFGSFT